jgi:hypothetical protein
MIAIELGARHPSIRRALVADDPGPVHTTDLANRLYPGFAEELAGPTGEVRRAWVVEAVGLTADEATRRCSSCGRGLAAATTRRVCGC